jgi:hypothetical protein
VNEYGVSLSTPLSVETVPFPPLRSPRQIAEPVRFMLFFLSLGIVSSDWSFCGVESLLLVILDDLRWTDVRLVRITPGVAQRAALAQEIPALIQFDFNVRQPIAIGICERPLPIEMMLFCNEPLDMIKHGLVCGLLIHVVPPA